MDKTDNKLVKGKRKIRFTIQWNTCSTLRKVKKSERLYRVPVSSIPFPRGRKTNKSQFHIEFRFKPGVQERILVARNYQYAEKRSVGYLTRYN